MFTHNDKERGLKTESLFNTYFENEGLEKMLFMKDLHHNNIEELLDKVTMKPFCVKMKNRGGYGAFLDEGSQKELTQRLLMDINNTEVSAYTRGWFESKIQNTSEKCVIFS
jgi:DNA-directed RNA polymerase